MSSSYVLSTLKGFGKFRPPDMLVGIDPDLHTTALCWWPAGELTPRRLEIFRVPKEIKGQDCAAFLQHELLLSRLANLAVIEGQQIRTARGHETKNPKSIVDLATVAGVFAGRPEFGETLIVQAQQWKGSVPKQIHQARILARIPGTKYKTVGTKEKGYCYPTAGPLITLGKAAGLRRGDWKHVVDAIGIAQWTIRKIKELERRDSLTR